MGIVAKPFRELGGFFARKAQPEGRAKSIHPVRRRTSEVSTIWTPLPGTGGQSDSSPVSPECHRLGGLQLDATAKEKERPMTSTADAATVYDEFAGQGSGGDKHGVVRLMRSHVSVLLPPQRVQAASLIRRVR